MQIRVPGAALRLLTISFLAPAFAFCTAVTYSTSGSISGFGATLTEIDGLALSYVAVTNASLSSPFPTNAQFGSFGVSGPMSGASDSFATTFVLTLSQSEPLPGGAETLASSLTGAISGNSSDMTVTFTTGSGSDGAPVLGRNPITGAPAYIFTLGDVTYWIDETTPIVPSSAGGVSIISGAVSEASEPGSVGLAGAALLLMAIPARFCKRGVLSRRRLSQ